MTRKLIAVSAAMMFTMAGLAAGQNTNTNTNSNTNTSNTNSNRSTNSNRNNNGNTNRSRNNNNTNSNRNDNTDSMTNTNSNRSNNTNSNRSNTNSNRNMNTNGDPMMVSTGTVSTSGRSGMAGMNSRPVTMTPAMMDSKFAMDAAYSNNAEIAAGQMALRKSQDSEVRQYAQMMIDHHTAANTDLATAAQGMTLPAGLDPMHQALADGMEKLSGADFDMAYIKSQKAGHAMTRDMIDMYEDKGDNRNLKGYAKRTEPVVKQHHAVIMNIDARMHAMHMGGAAPRSQ